MSEYSKEYYRKNKEKIDAYKKEYEIKNKERNSLRYKEYYQKNKEKLKQQVIKRLSIPEEYKKQMLRVAKQNALKLNVPFTLEIQDIIIPNKCPYLDCELTFIRGRGLVQTNASIDRIDPQLGYVKENIQIISFLANVMKHNATEQQLIAFAKGVLKQHAISTMA